MTLFEKNVQSFEVEIISTRSHANCQPLRALRLLNPATSCTSETALDNSRALKTWPSDLRRNSSRLARTIWDHKFTIRERRWRLRRDTIFFLGSATRRLRAYKPSSFPYLLFTLWANPSRSWRERVTSGISVPLRKLRDSHSRLVPVLSGRSFGWINDRPGSHLVTYDVSTEARGGSPPQWCGVVALVCPTRGS